MLQPWMPGWDTVFSDESFVSGATQHLHCCFSNLLCVFIKTGEVFRVLGSFASGMDINELCIEPC